MSKLDNNSITVEHSSLTNPNAQQISEDEFIRWAFRKAEQIRLSPDIWAELDSKRAVEFADSL